MEMLKHSYALHATRDAGLSKAGEVVERETHDGGAEDDVQVDKDRRASRGHGKEELDEHDPDHRVQSSP